MPISHGARRKLLAQANRSGHGGGFGTQTQGISSLNDPWPEVRI